MDPETKCAQTATPGDPANTVFGKIIRGEIKSDFIYEDDKCVAFHDLNKQAPVHILIIPKTPISQMSTASDEHKEILGHLLIVAKKLAETETDGNGFRLVINDGKNGGQSVYYIHVHLLANRQMTWPPG